MPQWSNPTFGACGTPSIRLLINRYIQKLSLSLYEEQQKLWLKIWIIFKAMNSCCCFQLETNYTVECAFVLICLARLTALVSFFYCCPQEASNRCSSSSSSSVELSFVSKQKQIGRHFFCKHFCLVQIKEKNMTFLGTLRRHFHTN